MAGVLNLNVVAFGDPRGHVSGRGKKSNSRWSENLDETLVLPSFGNQTRARASMKGPKVFSEASS